MQISEKIKTLEKMTKVMRVVLIVFALYLIVFPYFPKIKYALSSFNDKLSSENNLPQEITEAFDRGDDWLYIEKSKVSRRIIETDSIKKVHEDVWIWPESKKPSEGGNTVLLAHRYASIGGNRASTFYNLPDMQVGDKTFVLWDGKVYEYQVLETAVVEPTQVEILENTEEDILTMFTCTPLWTSKQRFVVKSKLIKVWEL